MVSPITRLVTVPAAIEPLTAGWKSRLDPYEDYYGLPELTPDARRLDVSLPWLSAAGGRPSLELFASLGVERIAAHNLGLAAALTGELGLPAPESPIVRFPVENPEAAAKRLRSAGVACSVRGGCVRLSFHLYNDEADVEPSSVEVIAARCADELAEGAFLLAVPRVTTAGKLVRVNLSLDRGMLDAIDAAAAGRKLTRSAFLAEAARNEIQGAH